MSISRSRNLLIFWFVLGVFIVHNVRAWHYNRMPNPNCFANGHYCQTHMECCSGKCMTYSYMCAPKVSPVQLTDTYGRPQISYNNLYPSWKPTQHERPIEEQLEFIPLPTEKPTTEKVNNSYGTTTSAYDDSVESRTCKPIGYECSDSVECCTMRCHSYLHKCVS